jgi:hypothetical protein
MKSRVVLGTAHFGSSVNFNESEKILDLYFTKFNRIQTSTNYPIDSNMPFNTTLDFIETYVKHKNITCDLIINIGSLSNKFSNKSDLSASFFYSNFLMLKNRFPNSFLTLSIHWDSEDLDRTELIKVFSELKGQIKIGLSGIKFLDNYSTSNLQYTYQVNSFLDMQSDFLISSNIRKKLPVIDLIGYQILGGNKISKNRMAEVSKIYQDSDAKRGNLLIKVLNENFLRYDSVIIAPNNLNQTYAWMHALEYVNG